LLVIPCLARSPRQDATRESIISFTPTESTGIKGAFNTALTGDPRGICLSRCEDWKKVKQSAYAFATLISGDGRQDIRVLATAFSETLAPEEVVGEALSKIQSSIDVRAEATKTP
jgi:hypothetical protein